MDWIHQADIEWFVRYVADEAAFGSVHVPAAIPPVRTPNSIVPGLHIRWDFQRDDAWEATFVEGPLQGTQVNSSVAKLTEDKWNSVSGRITPGEKIIK